MDVGVIIVAENISGHNKAAQPEVPRLRQDEDVKVTRISKFMCCSCFFESQSH
jgi:hypothetical protein